MEDPLEVLKEALIKWDDKYKEDKFMLREITGEETLKYIDTLKNTNTCGEDVV